LRQADKQLYTVGCIVRLINSLRRREHCEADKQLEKREHCELINSFIRREPCEADKQLEKEEALRG
jgi:hypothetical protein